MPKETVQSSYLKQSADANVEATFGSKFSEGNLLSWIVQMMGFAAGDFDFKLIPTFKEADKFFKDNAASDYVALLTSFGIPKEAAEAFGEEMNEVMPKFALGRFLFGLVTYPRLLLAFMGPPAAATAKRKALDWDAVLKPNIGTFEDFLINDWRFPNSQMKAAAVDLLGINDDWLGPMRTAREGWPDDQQINTLFHRATIDDDQWGKLQRGNGNVSEQWLERLRELRHPVLDINQIGELYRRDNLLDHEYQERLSKLGWRKGDIERLTELMSPLLGVGELLELWRRGKLDESQAKLALYQHYGTDKNFKNLKELRFRNMTIDDARVALHRGFIDQPSFMNKLERLGYNEDDRQKLYDSSFLLANPSDLVRMAVREVFTPSIASEFGLFEEFPEQFLVEGKKIGYDEQTLKNLWASHWILPSAGQGFEMRHRGIIDEEKLMLLLRAQDYVPGWRSEMMQISFKLIPRRALGKLVRQDLYQYGKTKKAYQDLGYSPRDAGVFAKSVHMDAIEDDRQVTKGDILSGYRRGVIPVSTAREMLGKLRYSDIAISFMITQTDYLIGLDVAKAANRNSDAEATKAINQTKSDILKALGEGLLTISESTLYLVQLGYSRTAIEYLVNQQKLKAYIDERDHEIDILHSQYVRGIVDWTTTQIALTKTGYSSDQIVRYERRWRLEKRAQDAIDEFPTFRPSRADLKRWYKGNIISEDEWRESMGELRIRDQDIERYLMDIKNSQRDLLEV